MKWEKSLLGYIILLSCTSKNHCLIKSSFFYRYWFALKYGCKAAFKQKSSRDASETDPPNFIQKQAVDVVTDINMLRVFKTFLETTPQLFVQIYILMEHEKNNFCQCESVFLLNLQVEYLS